MNPTQPHTAPTLGPREILLILLRNKWKISICALLGIAAAAGLYLLLPPTYESTATIFVRYIMEQPAGVPGDVQVRPGDSRGDSLMATEAEILSSWDLAQDVATAVGPEVILGANNSTNALFAAAKQIRENLKIDAATKGSVISLTYLNSRPSVPQRVLEEIVKRYKERHIAAHSSAGSFDDLTRQTDAMSSRIKDSESKLSKMKESLGITTIAETKTQLAGQISALETSIIKARAGLAESEARIAELQGSASAQMSLSSNLTTEVPPPVDEATAEQYRAVLAKLSRAHSREVDLLGQYTGEQPQVKQIRAEIADADRERKALETAHPGLLALQRVAPQAGPATASTTDISLDRASIAAARAQLKTLEEQLAVLKKRRDEVTAAENEITDLERSLALDEKSYEQSQVALRAAQFNEKLDPSKMPNMNILQNPSIPMKAAGKRFKICAGAAFAGLALGIGLAFLKELVLDQSVRGPMELEASLQLPMFMSIPLLSDRQPVRLLGNGSSDSPAAGELTRPERAPWEVSHFIRPYSDALRDRLIMYFQLKNIHHKPKLVAVTSCSDGAGTTTLAASLAASLSETGDGKVLLVDMNVSRPEMHPFFRGNLAASLTDLFQSGGKPGYGQYENLYLATATERNGEVTPLVPAKFYEMLPRMRSSDFDYIIFDMPAVKQTTATVALSGFMDKVLLLVEPGKTNREAVKRATHLMRQQHADVAGVVNRLPASALKWLQPDLA